MDPSPAFLSLIAALGAGTAAFARWAFRLWAQVRREALAQARSIADRQHEDTRHMTDALVAQAASNAALAAKIDQLTAGLDHLAGVRSLVARVEEALGSPTSGATRTPTEIARRTTAPHLAVVDDSDNA